MKAWRIFERYLFWFLFLPLLGVLGGFWVWFSHPPVFEANTTLTIVAQVQSTAGAEGVMKATDSYVKSLLNLVHDPGVLQNWSAQGLGDARLGPFRQSSPNSLSLKVLGSQPQSARRALSVLVKTIKDEMAEQSRVPRAALRFKALVTPFSVQEKTLPLALVVVAGFFAGLFSSFLLVLLGVSLMPRLDTFSDLRGHFKRAFSIRRGNNLSWLPLLENLRHFLIKRGNITVISGRNSANANFFLKELSSRLERMGYRVILSNTFEEGMLEEESSIGIASFNLKELPETLPLGTEVVIVVLERGFSVRSLDYLKQMGKVSMPVEVVWYEK